MNKEFVIHMSIAVTFLYSAFPTVHLHLALWSCHLQTYVLHSGDTTAPHHNNNIMYHHPLPQDLSMICSVLNLTCMSLERFYAIVYPLRSRSVCTVSQVYTLYMVLHGALLYCTPRPGGWWASLGWRRSSWLSPGTGYRQGSTVLRIWTFINIPFTLL